MELALMPFEVVLKAEPSVARLALMTTMEQTNNVPSSPVTRQVC